jgi:ferritin-like metal-binding protein YciE
MATIDTTADLLIEELRKLYSAEIQLIKAMPALIKAVTSSDLRKALEVHLRQTQFHAQRLEKIGKGLGQSLEGHTCKAMQGLVAEASEIKGGDAGNAMRDLALIGAAQKIEHHEIAGYGTARSLAYAAAKPDIAAILQETLDEEGDTDKLLTSIAVKVDLDARVAVDANAAE